MNRRSFISDIIKAGAAAMILPAATTYARSWKFVDESQLFLDQHPYVWRFKYDDLAGTIIMSHRNQPLHVVREEDLSKLSREFVRSIFSPGYPIKADAVGVTLTEEAVPNHYRGIFTL